MINPSELVMALFNARTAAHVAHLQATGPGSYAAHKALNEFYDDIVDIADRFAESWQGCYGLIKFAGSTFQVERDPVAMLKSLKALVEKARTGCDETNLQAILDDGLELIASTLYKLQHLK